MGGILILLLVLGAGALGLWLFAIALQALFGLFLALLTLCATIFTGKWLWDFITKDDDEEPPALTK